MFTQGMKSSSSTRESSSSIHAPYSSSMSVTSAAAIDMGSSGEMRCSVSSITPQQGSRSSIRLSFKDQDDMEEADARMTMMTIDGGGPATVSPSPARRRRRSAVRGRLSSSIVKVLEESILDADSSDEYQHPSAKVASTPPMPSRHDQNDKRTIIRGSLTFSASLTELPRALRRSAKGTIDAAFNPPLPMPPVRRVRSRNANAA